MYVIFVVIMFITIAANFLEAPRMNRISRIWVVAFAIDTLLLLCVGFVAFNSYDYAGVVAQADTGLRQSIAVVLPCLTAQLPYIILLASSQDRCDNMAAAEARNMVSANDSSTFAYDNATFGSAASFLESECEQETTVNKYFLGFVDYMWFVFLAFTPMMLPEAPPIHVTAGVDDEEEETTELKLSRWASTKQRAKAKFTRTGQQV